MKGAGNFKLKPLKKTNLGVGKPFLGPEKDHFVTIFFDHMN